MKLLLRALLLALVTAAPLAAQAPKKLIGKAEWDSWKSIQGATISSDGKWVAYTLSPGVGDGEFVVRSTTGQAEYRVPVGYVARPNNTPGGLRGAGAGAAAAAGGGGGGRGGRGGGGAPAGPFTADNRYAFVMTQAPKAVVDSVTRAQAAGRGARGGRAGAPVGGAGAAPGSGRPAPQANPATRNVLKMISLADGKVTELADWRSYRLPRYNGKWLVYSAAADSGTASADSAQGGRGAAPPARGGGAGRAGGAAAADSQPRRALGNAIVLRNLDTGADEPLSDVVSYAFDDSAKVLAYVVGSRSDSTKDGVYIRNMATGTTKAVVTGPGNYRNFSFDRTQGQFVFSSDRDQFGRDSAQSAIYVGSVRTGTAQPVITPATLPRGMRLAANGNATFNRSATALTLAIQPPPESEVPADQLVNQPVFDLWHWKDPDIQTVQKLRVNQARNRSYQAIYHLASKKLVQLTNDTITNVSLSDDGMRAVANSTFPYRIESMWGADGNDIYIVDPTTGAKKLIREKIDGNAQLSVGAKYAIYFHEGDWFTYDIATGKEANITGAMKDVRFDQETWSTPGAPSSWGVAGWTRGDSTVLLYDRFDIWQVDPHGTRAPVMVTDSVGRRENITFRIVDLEPDEERTIDTSKPFYLSAFDEDTKQSGFYRDQVGVRRAPERIVMADVRYGTPQKARNADMWMVTKSTFVEFPDLHVGPNLTQLTRISDANPQQKDYNWGTAELVTWLNMDGEQLQGILYKPENFDPSKKYPMISYFYEDLSDGLHGYIAPAGRSSINVTTYVSNGYLVFEPDITYDIGRPGQSAVKSIIPGVQMLLARGYVDPKGLGLQGHSWGGYQTAYLITQSTMFAGAEAGAPVANMTSAYGGIRWGSGINRSTQYERGQSRIGKSIWEAQNLYIENSPLFFLDRVTTPLLILHDDMDDAVPWYQGIELYIGMRRLGKEAYLFNYNNELHSPAARQNQQDFAMRTMQFFDVTLKKKPAPDWMVNGIPAKDKGREFLPPPVIRP
jgi:dipeptidyl aminopeptidase/acylaminoacyl peptidase